MDKETVIVAALGTAAIAAVVGLYCYRAAKQVEAIEELENHTQNLQKAMDEMARKEFETECAK